MNLFLYLNIIEILIHGSEKRKDIGDFNATNISLKMTGLGHLKTVLFVYKTYVNESAWFSDGL